MNKPCFYLCIFCLGVLVGEGAENPIMNLVTVLALIGAISPTFQGVFEQELDAEEEEDEQDINKQFYNKPYNPFKK